MWVLLIVYILYVVFCNCNVNVSKYLILGIVPIQIFSGILLGLLIIAKCSARTRQTIKMPATGWVLILTLSSWGGFGYFIWRWRIANGL